MLKNVYLRLGCAGFLFGALSMGCVALTWFYSATRGHSEKYDDSVAYGSLPWVNKGGDWSMPAAVDGLSCGSGPRERQASAAENPCVWQSSLAMCMVERVRPGMSLQELLEVRPRVEASRYYFVERPEGDGVFLMLFRYLAGDEDDLRESYTFVDNALVRFGLGFHSNDYAKVEETFHVLATTLERRFGQAPAKETPDKPTVQSSLLWKNGPNETRTCHTTHTPQQFPDGWDRDSVFVNFVSRKASPLPEDPPVRPFLKK